jgi:hypothetical protein
LIHTLVITICIESLVVLAYCYWRKKPVSSILLTSVVANLMTQSLLWTVVNIFYQDYLVTLLVAEIFIWLIESFALYYIRGNQLTFRESTLLSLGMNLSSILVGWLLPV